MILPPPHRAILGSGSRPEGTGSAGRARPDGADHAAARDAVAEVVRVTLLDDAARQDRREDLAFQARARRAGFLAQAVAEVTPPEPVPASYPDPRAPAGAALYRARAGTTPAVDRMHPMADRIDLSA